ncbi:uncharacterized protein LOC131472996 [Solea solea]|uniref:uncharacterized protein LOC131472996 n=1 Tax=Solea solea TaxID=90069 RepID=UPI00272B8C43|nr:uncharacterized protein LOC131472996 [Solea solea]
MSANMTDENFMQLRFSELLQQVKDWRLREQLRAAADRNRNALLSMVDDLKRSQSYVIDECAAERAEKEAFRQQRDHLRKQVDQLRTQFPHEKVLLVERQLMEPEQENNGDNDTAAKALQLDSLVERRWSENLQQQLKVVERTKVLAKAEKEGELTPSQKKEKGYLQELGEMQLLYKDTKETFKNNLEKLKEDIAQKEARNRELDLILRDPSMEQKLREAKSRILFLSLKVQELKQRLTRYENGSRPKVSLRWNPDTENMRGELLQLKPFREKKRSITHAFLHHIQPWNWGKKFRM